MSYRVEMRPRARQKLASWNLPDAVLVEAYLQANDRRSINPAGSMVRMLVPFDGMVFRLEMIDPRNRFAIHRIFFHVVYSMDEETVLVLDCAYFHTIGM